MNNINLIKRPQRLRKSENLRNLIAEYNISTQDLICPVFVVHGTNIKKEIDGLKNQYHYSIDNLKHLIKDLKKNEILSVIIFGVPKIKDDEASENYSKNGIVQQAIIEFKKIAPEIIVIADICLCSYVHSGHCGIFENNLLNNDKTLKILQKTALSYAESGVDIVAPSGMMDNMIFAIRNSLDENNFSHIGIMSYAVKYASSFYNPFRGACATTLEGDRKSYQMDFRNKKEALREALIDDEQGADFLMVKPSLCYLDIIQDLRQNFNTPIVAYNVSGEYAMLKLAAEHNLINEKDAVLETLISLKRAGANLIITYFALDIYNFLQDNNN